VPARHRAALRLHRPRGVQLPLRAAAERPAQPDDLRRARGGRRHEDGVTNKVYRYGFDPPYRLEVTPLYAQLRSEEPVARVKLPYGEDGWLVTRHASVKAILGDA